MQNTSANWIIRLLLSLLCWPKVILLSGTHFCITFFRSPWYLSFQFCVITKLLQILICVTKNDVNRGISVGYRTFSHLRHFLLVLDLHCFRYALNINWNQSRRISRTACTLKHYKWSTCYVFTVGVHTRYLRRDVKGPFMIFRHEWFFFYLIRGQFHQRSTRSFYAISLLPVEYKAKM